MPGVRQLSALKTRKDAALQSFLIPTPQHLNNGEENQYRNEQNQLNYIANFSKGLPHDYHTGEVHGDTYKKFQRQLLAGHPAQFDVELGMPPGEGRLFVNPFAGLCFDLEGPDSVCQGMPPAPRIDSAEGAAELGEVYWMTLLRDINFTEFDDNSDVLAACDSLSDEFSDYRGSKDSNGRVTPKTLFRGVTTGDLVGPYISQFLLQGSSDLKLDGIIKYGSLTIQQKQKTVIANQDYLADWSSFLNVQNGLKTFGQDQFDETPRFVRNLRDLANYVHFDQLYQAYLNACLLMFAAGVPFDTGNPYLDSTCQHGFITFGAPHVMTLLAEVSTRVLKAVWYQKWFVHRRLRPEAFAGLVHRIKTQNASYPVQEDILNSSVLDRIYQHNRKQNGPEATYLLPQVYPEGSPLHPAYGAGHSALAGACVTILKAFFDESFIMDDPVIPNHDGTVLEKYSPATGPPPPPGDEGDDDSVEPNQSGCHHPEDKVLTIGGELNKLAANMSIGRNMAGVHYLTDYTEALKLGEAVAIGILQEQRLTFNEDHFFNLTKFDGTVITI